jgi:hypothetical protein
VTKEVRCILFDEAEIRVAILEYLGRTGRLNNAALVARIELVDEVSGIAGYVHFQSAAALRPVNVDVADLLTAMLMFCGANRVPLPRRALKALMLHRNTLILSITDHKFVQSRPTVANNELTYVDSAAKTIIKKVLSSIPAVEMQD